MEPRQALYVGLSLAFRPPTHAHVEGGPDNVLLGMVAEAAEIMESLPLKEPISRMGDYLRALAPRDVAEALVELEAEYNRLFVGPMPPLAHPYESVYRTAGGLVMGDCTLDVLRSYAQEGFVLSAEYKDLPDHVAVELEFMALLCQREEEASIAGLGAIAGALQRIECAFLEGHLRRWLPQFCQRVLLAAPSLYYGQWAQMTDLFTQWDVQRCSGQGGRSDEPVG